MVIIKGKTRVNKCNILESVLFTKAYFFTHLYWICTEILKSFNFLHLQHFRVMKFSKWAQIMLISSDFIVDLVFLGGFFASVKLNTAAQMITVISGSTVMSAPGKAFIFPM